MLLSNTARHKIKACIVCPKPAAWVYLLHGYIYSYPSNPRALSNEAAAPYCTPLCPPKLPLLSVMGLTWGRSRQTGRICQTRRTRGVSAPLLME